jgi:Uma2 family endonuclease
MYTLVSREKTELSPGTVVRMPGTWQDYCVLRNSRGDGAIPRIKFRKSEILLMSPLPRHGREAHLLARVVEILLESQERNYEAFTPITMEVPEEGGIEPDYCFYIDNWQAAAGKDWLNWQVDPPPDLVVEVDMVEVDITSYTAVEDFLPYGVPEVWIFKRRDLRIYGLVGAGYELRGTSRYFPGVDLSGLIEQVLMAAAERGTGVALRELRLQLGRLGE